MDSVNLIPVVAIIGGIAVAIVSILTGARMRELKIRERIAMIEKGLVPPPEVDPAGFDRILDRSERYELRRAGRGRRAGIILIGVGVGVMVLNYADAGSSMREVLRPGGFLVVLGLAFLISSLFDRPHKFPPSQPPRTPPIPPSTE